MHDLSIVKEEKLSFSHMLLCSFTLTPTCVMFRRSQNFNWIHSMMSWSFVCECDSWLSHSHGIPRQKAFLLFSKSVYHENFMIKLQHSGHTAAHRVQWHIHETFCSLRFLIITVSCAFIMPLSYPLCVSSCVPSMNALDVEWLAWESL
jgi:hypothetical protein